MILIHFTFQSIKAQKESKIKILNDYLAHLNCKSITVLFKLSMAKGIVQCNTILILPKT